MKNLFSFFLITIFLSACSEVPGNKVLFPPDKVKSKLGQLDCKWTRDDQGFVHVFGSNDLGTFACMGYAHALDRAWQMDYHRRITQGRVAELHGTSKLKMDFMMRLLGLYERAEKIYQDVETNDLDTTLWLWAYSMGVNKRFDEIKTGDVYEFDKLGYRPAQWSPIDSIALLLLQSFDQTRQTFLREIEEEKLLVRWGRDKEQLFLDENLPWETTILKSGEYKTTPKVAENRLLNSIRSQSSDEKAYQSVINFNLSFFEPLFENSETGSNNWVLAPKRSQSGNALFSNDPHLSLKYPPFWHWIQLQNPSWRAMGASFPGIPSIASGYNNFAAWGITNSYLDTARVASVNEDRLVTAKTIKPTVWVKFLGVKWPIFFKSFQKTKEDYPVLPLDSKPGRKLVLYWTGFEIGWQNIGAIRHVASDNSAKQILDHLAQANIPSWNFVAADIKGNIGYQATGYIIKHTSTPRFGVTELTNDQAIKPELLDTTENPHLFNPKRGFIATANHRHWPKDSQYHGGNSYKSPFRGFRIEELLLKTEKHSFETMRDVICDYQAVDARFITPKLLEHIEINSDRSISNAMNLLKQWDYMTTLDCQPCALYRRTVDLLLSALGSNDQPANIAFLYRWLASDFSKEKSGLVTKLFIEAIAQTQETQSVFKKWGEIHRNYFPHLSDDSTFNGDQWLATPGDDHSISPGTNEWRKGHYEHTSGASQRLFVELNPNYIRGIVMLPGTNQDLENKDLNNTESPFLKWRDCVFQDVQYEIPWDSIAAQEVRF